AVRAADVRVHRRRFSVRSGVRVRRRRGLPPVACAGRAHLRRVGRPAAHRRVDWRRMGALEATSPTSSNLHNLPPTSPGGALMKRVALTLGLAAVWAPPAVAQWLGEPVWNSPSGGTGVTISGDYAHPNEGYGKGNTWGGRASLGLSTITLTAGVASWKPAGATQSLTSVGGNVAFRLIGGSLLPFAINMQLGGASTSSGGVAAKAT